MLDQIKSNEYLYLYLRVHPPIRDMVTLIRVFDAGRSGLRYTINNASPCLRTRVYKLLDKPELVISINPSKRKGLNITLTQISLRGHGRLNPSPAT